MAKYLDKSGVTYLWNKIKGLFTDQSLNTKNKTYAGAINEINTKVGNLTGAFLWKGKFDTLPAVTNYEAGNVVGVGKKEYVLTVTEGTKAWEEFGDEGSYLLKTTAEETYLKKTAGEVKTANLADNAVTENKLNDDLRSKVNDNVKTITQTLTDTQKAQARQNIDVLEVTQQDIDNLPGGGLDPISDNTTPEVQEIETLLGFDVNGNISKTKTIDTKHLATGAVTTPKIADKAVVREKLSEDLQKVLDNAGTSGNGGLLYKTTEIINLSDNVAVGDFTLAEGWDGDAVSGYTHSSGMNAISLNVQTTNGEVYLFEADVEIADSTIEFCKANFGNNPQCLTYNGTNHISVPLLSDGGQFILTPATTKTFKLSNITLQKISDEGIEKILNLYNIISVNHNKNYGFWNVLLGASSMQDAVGSTRTIAIGNFALNALKSGNRNIAVGTYSMNKMVNGENNIAIGADAMMGVKSAQNCVAIGKGIMGKGKSLNNNVAIGSGCIHGSSDSESSYNIGIGFDAGYNITGQSNTCIGYKAGEFIGAGSANVAIGRSVSIGSGTNRNTCVGDRSSVAEGVSDSIAIGTLAAATKSKQMVLGGTGITEVVMCGNKKIIFNEDGSVTWETIS